MYYCSIKAVLCLKCVCTSFLHSFVFQNIYDPASVLKTHSGKSLFSGHSYGCGSSSHIFNNSSTLFSPTLSIFDKAPPFVLKNNVGLSNPYPYTIDKGMRTIFSILGWSSRWWVPFPTSIFRPRTETSLTNSFACMFDGYGYGCIVLFILIKISCYFVRNNFVNLLFCKENM